MGQNVSDHQFRQRAQHRMCECDLFSEQSGFHILCNSVLRCHATNNGQWRLCYRFHGVDCSLWTHFQNCHCTEIKNWRHCRVIICWPFQQCNWIVSQRIEGCSYNSVDNRLVCSTLVTVPSGQIHARIEQHFISGSNNLWHRSVYGFGESCVWLDHLRIVEQRLQGSTSDESEMQEVTELKSVINRENLRPSCRILDRRDMVPGSMHTKWQNNSLMFLYVIEKDAILFYFFYYSAADHSVYYYNNNDSRLIMLMQQDLEGHELLRLYRNSLFIENAIMF